MEINEQYKDLWAIKDTFQAHLDKGKPVVVFADGRNVTNNHKGFRMIGADGFTQKLFECSKDLVRQINTDAVIYVGIDELSVVFTKPSDVFRYFGVGDAACYISTLFSQKLCKLFWQYYQCYFKCVSFSIKEKDVDRYIEYRKKVCFSGGLWYAAKEFLPKQAYKGLTLTEMETLVYENESTANYIKNYPHIIKGYETEIHKGDFEIEDIVDISELP